MLRDYGAGERTRRQRSLRPGNGGYHFSSFALRHENSFKRRRFLELLHANGRLTALLFTAGVITGWLGGSRSRKKRFPNRRLRCVHSARSECDTWEGLRSRAVATIVV